MAPGFETREYFHLLFLSHLSRRFAGRKWAVKGGICLRFFHRSARLSEDMDVDVDPGIPVSTLSRGVESILGSRAFLSSLVARGIGNLAVRTPKQTATVQRWKVGLAAGGKRLSSKLEFSRRRSKMEYSAGIPGPATLEAHSMAPFATQYYGPTEMVSQKVSAMASASRTAVRDLLDLDHLLVNCRPDRKKAFQMAGPDAVASAARKARAFSWRDFREEVAPFLSEGIQDLYGGPGPFEDLRGRVLSALASRGG